MLICRKPILNQSFLISLSGNIRAIGISCYDSYVIQIFLPIPIVWLYNCLNIYFRHWSISHPYYKNYQKIKFTLNIPFFLFLMIGLPSAQSVKSICFRKNERLAGFFKINFNDFNLYLIFSHCFFNMFKTFFRHQSTCSPADNMFNNKFCHFEIHSDVYFCVCRC